LAAHYHYPYVKAPAQKHVIVNEDDFGFSAGISAGIIRAHKEGIVTSTTVTANMPAAWNPDVQRCVLLTSPSLIWVVVCCPQQPNALLHDH